MKYRYEKLPTPCRAKKNNLAPALHLELPMTSWIFAEFTSVIFAYFVSLIFQSLTKSSPLIPFKHFFWRDSLIGVMSLVPHFFKNLRHQYLHLEMHVTITTVYMYLTPPSYLLFFYADTSEFTTNTFMERRLYHFCFTMNLFFFQ
jgi:hypothetical protein